MVLLLLLRHLLWEISTGSGEGGIINLSAISNVSLKELCDWLEPMVYRAIDWVHEKRFALRLWWANRKNLR